MKQVHTHLSIFILSINAIFHFQSNHFSYDKRSHVFSLKGQGRPDAVLQVDFGVGPNAQSVCPDSPKDGTLQVQWDRGSLTVAKMKGVPEEVSCFEVTSETQFLDFLQDCIQFGEDWWYGGAETKEQSWPINAAPGSNKMHPFTSHHSIRKKDGVPGSVLERYWLSSSGAAVFVSRRVPLYVGSTDTHLCLMTRQHTCYKSYQADNHLILQYSICTAADMKTVHKHMAARHWGPPSDIPDEMMIRYPVWSTWARYKKNISQETVLQFAEEIKHYKYPYSHLEIDDKYTAMYGDLYFDKSRFPHPGDMMNTLRDMGFRVTAWIHPYLEVQSIAFKEASAAGFLVQHRGESAIVDSAWGKVGILDVTNQAALKWHAEQRKNLDELGFHSYKYDLGESSVLPCHFTTTTVLHDPNFYSTLYAQAAYQITNKAMEVRVGYKSQHLPVFTRIMDVNSVWKGNRGLDIVIPSVLHFGLIGYPFVLPDIIGGNAYREQPTKELFIRWTQLTAFLPAMQFSYVPWQFDEETVEICRRYVQLHDEYISPLIIKWGRWSVQTGEPIIRPLWWLDPKDPKTYKESTSFLIGDDVLVAPVVEEGARVRDIYLPAGTWLDMLSKDTIYGPTTLRGYKVSLSDTPYFENIKQSS